MNLSQQEKEKLITFLGCGNADAPIWFIGMEPGACEKCLSLEENVEVRINSFGETISLSEAHHLLKEDNQKPSQVWLFASKIIRSLLNASDWDNTEKAKEYIHMKLGAINGITLAVELLPLPRPNIKIWPGIYKELFRNYKTYKEIILKKRLEFLKKKILIHKPKFIFAYGPGNHNDYRKLSGVETKWAYFPDLLKGCSSSDSYSSDRALSYVFIGTSNETIYVLLPFLGNGWIGHNDIKIITGYLKDNFPDKVQGITTSF